MNTNSRMICRPSTLALATFGLLVLEDASLAQSFSIDYRGPTITMPGPMPITAADVLVPTGPLAPGYAPPVLPPPTIGVGGGFAPAPSLGLLSVPGCVGAAPGVPCPAEVDALSWGTDFVPTAAAPLAGTWVFSVDEWAIGIPGSPLAPNVLSEAPCFDHSADVFEALNIPAGPVPPPAGPPVPGNSGLFDGNGFVSACGGRYPGVGIIEPRPAFPGAGARPGDNLDAVDLDPPPVPYVGAFYSVNGGFLDPCFLVPNSGTAAANGVLPGAILFSPPGGPPAMWAPPPLLGLDLLGPATDDIDALVVFNTPPFAFTPADYVRFSVRRGSAVIGLPDSNFGAPIEAGDILMPPPAPGMPPGIFIPAEMLGLATVRTGTAFVCGGGPQGDDLDALDTRPVPATGLAYCFGDGTGAACPCLNTGANGNGCGNVAFPGGANLSGTGAASVSGDTVVLTSTGMSGLSSLYFQGTGQAAIPFGYGINCLSGALIRVGLKTVAGGTSMNPSGIDLPLSLKGGVPPVGATRFYQTVYRQVMPACAPPPLSLTNRTNGYAIVWTP